MAIKKFDIKEQKNKLWKCVNEFINYYDIKNEDSIDDNDVDTDMRRDFINECCQIVLKTKKPQKNVKTFK